MYKVTIKNNSKKRRKSHYWCITCPLCKFRSHVNKTHWHLAINVANQHVRGNQHQNKLSQYKEKNR